MQKPEKPVFLKCGNIGSVWYGLIIIVLQVYAHYDEIENYMEFKIQSNDPRYGLKWNEKPATFCLLMTMLSLAMLPFFVYSTIVKTGNLVNDHVRLGGSDLSQFNNPRSLIFERLEKAVSRTNQPSVWRIMKYYFVPSCQSMHYVSSFLLLVPLSFLNAEKMRNSAICSDYRWTSDLHTILSIKDPDILTIVRQESETLRFPMATINFIIASLFLSFHTASVFWRTTKSFSFMIAIFDLAMSSNFLILNSSLSVSMQHYSLPLPGNSVAIGLYSQGQCYTMLIVGFFCYLVCRNLIFEFGLQRYMVNQRSFNQMLEEIRVPSISTGLLRNSREFKDRIRNQLQSFYINALAFFLWLVEVGCLIPLACYMVTIYWSTTRFFFLLGFISITCILVTWFCIWMILSIKHNWIFKVQSTVNAVKNENQPSEPIYTCFHENKALSHSSFNGDKKSSYSKTENRGDTYLEDNNWGKSDLYQLFKLPPDYNSMRVPSVTSIPSNFGNDQPNPTYQTVQRQQNFGSLLNGIDERMVMSPLTKAHDNNHSAMSQRNLMIPNHSQSDSAYQSCRMKNYSQDSLRSVTFGQRRKNLCDFNDFSRADNLTHANFETASNNDMYPTKENLLDDNTDISTDFSDQNTNSSGTDPKSNHRSRYLPLPYQTQLISTHDDDVYIQQTGV